MEKERRGGRWERERGNGSPHFSYPTEMFDAMIKGEGKEKEGGGKLMKFMCFFFSKNEIGNWKLEKMNTSPACRAARIKSGGGGWGLKLQKIEPDFGVFEINYCWGAGGRVL